MANCLGAHQYVIDLIYRKGIKDDLMPKEKTVLRKFERGSAVMNKRLFERLVESMEQHGEIARGERAPSRELHAELISERDSGLGATPPAEVRASPKRG